MRFFPLLLFVLVVVALTGCGERAPVFQSNDPEIARRNDEGVMLMGRYDYDGAFQAFASLLEDHPRLLDVRTNFAFAQLNRQREGDEAGAIEIFRSVLADDPSHQRARYGLGLLLVRAGEEEECREVFSGLAEDVPDDPFVQYFLAQAIEPEQPEAAAAGYTLVLELDPLLRSAVYRRSQVRRRLNDVEGAEEDFELFTALQDHPQARTVEWKYTRLGPLGEVVSLQPATEPKPKPAGGLFALSQPLNIEGLEGVKEWSAPSAIVPADFDGDGQMDMLLCNALQSGTSHVFLQGDGSGTGFRYLPDHPLAQVQGHAAVVADLDHSGGREVAFVSQSAPGIQLWQPTAQGYVPVLDEALAEADPARTIRATDVDHDGDLDLLTESGLFTANGDGSWRRQMEGLEALSSDAASVLPMDLDQDRDRDLVVVGQQGLWVIRNDRIWQWESLQIDDEPAQAVVGGDPNADGVVDLYVLRSTALDHFEVMRDLSMVRKNRTELKGTRSMMLADFSGDGRLELFCSGEGSAFVFSMDQSAGVGGLLEQLNANASGVRPVTLEPEAGPGLLTVQSNGPHFWAPGEGRFPFASVELTGEIDTGDSMRSNAEGLGTRLRVRQRGRWSVLEYPPASSFPGAGLEPLSIGLAGAEAIDFVAIDWSDGVFQTEPQLAAGIHRIAETQRQMSSCPVVFVHNGTSYEFVSDVLGVGGVGYLLAPNITATPRPDEGFLLPWNPPTGEPVRLKLAEPMEESCWLDAASVEVWSMPEPWDLVLDERLGINGPAPTGQPIFFRTTHHPVEARVNGQTCTESISASDFVAVDPGPLDPKFLGRLASECVLECEFGHSLDFPAALVVDGWVEYPYSQTMFASWQSGASWESLTLEARTLAGDWQVVLEDFGYPAGMPRTMAMPLPPLPQGSTAIRLRTNLEIHVDQVRLVEVESCPEATRQELALRSAQLSARGFARRTVHEGRRPEYDDADVMPFADMRTLPGWYTAFGDVLDLVEAKDNAAAVFGSGEEIAFEFDEMPVRLDGERQRVVLRTRGWCKDMDLFTKDGEQLLPGPPRKMDELGRSLEFGRRTRWQGGE